MRRRYKKSLPPRPRAAQLSHTAETPEASTDGQPDSTDGGTPDYALPSGERYTYKTRMAKGMYQHQEGTKAFFDSYPVFPRQMGKTGWAEEQLERYRKFYPGVAVYAAKLSDYIKQSKPAEDYTDIEARILAYCESDIEITRRLEVYTALCLFRNLMTRVMELLNQTPYVLRLEEPRGLNSFGGRHISIRWRGIEPRTRKHLVQTPQPWPTQSQAAMIGGISIGFGCPLSVAERVSDSLYASGRYDCTVAGSVNISNLESCLAQAGAFVIHVELKAYYDQRFKQYGIT